MLRRCSGASLRCRRTPRGQSYTSKRTYGEHFAVPLNCQSFIIHHPSSIIICNVHHRSKGRSSLTRSPRTPTLQPCSTKSWRRQAAAEESEDDNGDEEGSEGERKHAAVYERSKYHTRSAPRSERRERRAPQWRLSSRTTTRTRKRRRRPKGREHGVASGCHVRVSRVRRGVLGHITAPEGRRPTRRRRRK